MTNRRHLGGLALLALLPGCASMDGDRGGGGGVGPRPPPPGPAGPPPPPPDGRRPGSVTGTGRDGARPMRFTTPSQLPVLPFFLVTFAWTWSMWWGAVAAGLSFDQDTFRLLYLLGVFGPLVGAVWVVRRGDRAHRREFWRRVWDPRRVPAAWWLALVGVAAGPALLGAAAAAMSGATAQAPAYSAGLVGAVVVFALVAGLAEEPGWRGAASDAWQARTGPVWAALGIGALWALWHLPLHFVEGSYQHGIGFGTARFWLTNLALIQLGVLLVWLANGARGSILVAILGHAGFNAALGLVPTSTTRDVVGLLLISVATLAVIAATRGRLRFEVSAKPAIAGAERS
jgi:uncharacterized protein